MRLERQSEAHRPPSAPPKGQEKGQGGVWDPGRPRSKCLSGPARRPGAGGEWGLAQARGLVEVEVRVH